MVLACRRDRADVEWVGGRVFGGAGFSASLDFALAARLVGAQACQEGAGLRELSFVVHRRCMLAIAGDVANGFALLRRRPTHGAIVPPVGENARAPPQTKLTPPAETPVSAQTDPSNPPRPPD